MRRVIFAVFGTVAGLVGLLSFKTSTASTASAPAAVSATAPTDTSAAGNQTTSIGTGSNSSSSTSGSSSTNAASSSASSKTATGNVINTRWGPVQVRIAVTNGKLSSVTAIQYPNGNPRDQEINASAIPTLTRETIAAGNAKIDMVSGATYTSLGYISSLQSALNKAGL